MMSSNSNTAPGPITTTPGPIPGDGGFQIQYILRQNSPPPPTDPRMKVYVSSYPPLGQVTPIDKSADVFTALLEVDGSRAASPWQVSLWYSDGGEWREQVLELVKDEASRAQSLQSPETAANTGAKKLYYSTRLAIHRETTFTIKFRSGSEDTWKWVHDHQGLEDGVIVPKSSKAQTSSNLGDYIQGLNPNFKVEPLRSQSPGTTLWSVESSIEAAVGGKSTVKDVTLGLPWGKGKFLR